LNAEKLPVSELGHQLGFASLSHFSRVFKKQIGIKPKKYSAMQAGSRKSYRDIF
jgi:AraC-like DNA-binding protein